MSTGKGKMLSIFLWLFLGFYRFLSTVSYFWCLSSIRCWIHVAFSLIGDAGSALSQVAVVFCAATQIGSMGGFSSRVAPVPAGHLWSLSSDGARHWFMVLGSFWALHRCGYWEQIVWGLDAAVSWASVPYQRRDLLWYSAGGPSGRRVISTASTLKF
ncbi:hypothetical protein V6N13_057390 [Hibiscus sabdariffa]